MAAYYQGRHAVEEIGEQQEEEGMVSAEENDEQQGGSLLKTAAEEENGEQQGWIAAAAAGLTCEWWMEVVVRKDHDLPWGEARRRLSRLPGAGGFDGTPLLVQT